MLNSRFFLLLFCCILAISACKKKNDSAPQFREGVYHVVGKRQFTLGGVSDPPVVIDTFVTVKKEGSDAYKLYYLGSERKFTYSNSNLSYLPDFDKYFWAQGSYHHGSTLMFHKTPDDSIFYFSSSGSYAGYTSTDWAGVKIQ